MRRAARLAVLYVLEALAALLALAIFAGAAVLWRLAEGPVDAELLRPAATEALLNAVDADAASIGALEVSFDPGAAALVVRRADAGGKIALHPPPMLPLILLLALVTAFVSGIFGAAGGLMLMGALAFLLPVNQSLALRRWRPTRRLALMILRPLLVFIRARNPYRRARLILERRRG